MDSFGTSQNKSKPADSASYNVLEELQLRKEAYRRCDPQRIHTLKEREYQYLQCVHRGGVEPEVAARMYGFVLVNGSAEDQAFYEHYLQLKKEAAENIR